jgi:hypothetical protein
MQVIIVRRQAKQSHRCHTCCRVKPTRRRLAQSPLRPHCAPILRYSARLSYHLGRRHYRTDHQSAHRAIGPLPEQLLSVGYLSAAVSSGHRNGVALLSTSVRRYWLIRHRRGAHQLGSGCTVGVKSHRGELR